MLPTTTPQLPSTDSLTQNAVDLAKAVSDYGVYQVIFGVFMVLIFAIVLMFLWQLIVMSKKVNTIDTNTKKINEYFDGVNEHTLGGPAANVLVRREMAHISALVKYYIVRTRVENNIEDTEEIKVKVTRIVENIFTELNTFLSNYTVNGKKLSSVVDPKDKQAMIDLMIEQTYITKNKYHVYAMDQTVEIFITGIKNIYLEKI